MPEIDSEMPQPKVVNRRASALLQFKSFGQVYTTLNNLAMILDWLAVDLGIDHFGVRLSGIDVWMIYALP